MAFVVGSLINVYSQLLVPWFRDRSDPFGAFVSEFDARPRLATFSVFLGYAFSFCVGTYSAVRAQYKLRRIVSIADFPDRKPDPVFRALASGEIVEVRVKAKEMFNRHNIDHAENILGEKVWTQILSNQLEESGTKVFFEAEAAEYLVTDASTDEGQINIYLARVT